MYRLQEVQEKLLHIVGWDQSFDPAKVIEDSLTTSESGLTFQGAHPLVTLENIRSIMPGDFVFQYKPWSAIRYYKKGDKVAYNDIIFIATVDNHDEEPFAGDFNGDFSVDFSTYEAYSWKPYNYLSDYLEWITKNGIKTAIQTFVQDKKLAHETRDLLVNKTFFDGAARLKATISPMSRLVGMEITPVRSMGVTMRINRIGLQMVGATGTVRMYLFHSSQSAPIRTLDLNFTNTNGGFQWFNISDLFLPYISDDTDSL